jgi:hypothetical protein
MTLPAPDLPGILRPVNADPPDRGLIDPRPTTPEQLTPERGVPAPDAGADEDREAAHVPPSEPVPLPTRGLADPRPDAAGPTGHISLPREV